VRNNKLLLKKAIEYKENDSKIINRIEITDIELNKKFNVNICQKSNKK